MSDMQFQQVLANAQRGQPEAQFLLSQILLQNRDIAGMLEWLQKASDTGFAPAVDTLGHCYEKGQGVERDFDAALDLYDRAIEGGSGLAAYRKAELTYKSRQGPARQDLIRDLLYRAAAQDLGPALRAIGYLALQEEADRPLAIDCFRRAALAGDINSSFNLGLCLLRDGDGHDSKAEAAHHLRRAAAARYPFADALLQDLASVQPLAQPLAPTGPLKPGADFPLYPAPGRLDPETICEDPGIAVFSEVLTMIDRAHLMYLALPRLTRAHVIDPDGGKDGMVSEVRTSMSTYLPFGVVDLIGRHVELKIVVASGEKLETSEPMSILRYAPGEFYKPHVDYFNPNLRTSEELLRDGGQRTASAVTYLAAPTAGGGTSFPRLKLSVPAVAGSTLWFRNCHADGRIDERSLHAGDTVRAGEKWVVTKWFREKPTSYLPY